MVTCRPPEYRILSILFELLALAPQERVPQVHQEHTQRLFFAFLLIPTYLYFAEVDLYPSVLQNCWYWQRVIEQATRCIEDIG